MLLRDDDDDDLDIKQDLILEQYLPYRLAIVAHLMSRGFTNRYRDDVNITIAQWRVMAILGYKSPQSAHEIAARCYLDKVQVSRAVANLLERGWLLREEDEEDKRRTQLSLSPQGDSVFKRMGKTAISYEDDVCASLSVEEYASLDRILRKLSRRAEALS